MLGRFWGNPVVNGSLYRPLRNRFLHYWRCLVPPPISSPYLNQPFNSDLNRILSEHASKAKIAIEFGCLFGYTTSIIAKNLPADGTLYSYDLFVEMPPVEVRSNLNRVGVSSSKVTLVRASVFEWMKDPQPFDFMWIDAALSSESLRYFYECLRPFIVNGSVVLAEGTHRRFPIGRDIPHVDLCTSGPGIFRMLP